MNDKDDLTRTLSRELEDRTHAMDGSTLHLADVKGRARSIRRRRTATAVAGVAAAVAVIVPSVSLMSHSNGKPEPGPATHSPSQTQTAKDGHQPPAGVLDVSDLPTGAAPQIAYVTDGTLLHEADGDTVDVGTAYPVSSFAVLKDGSHVWQTMDDRGNAYVEIQDSEGSFQQPVPSIPGLSVSRSHDAAAWATPDGQVMVYVAGAAAPRTLGEPVPAPQGLRMGPFGSDDCVPDYCSVFVNASSGNQGPRPWEVSDHSTGPFTDGDMRTVADVAGGVFVGYTKITDFGSCSSLWGGGEFRGFDTCKHTLTSISPDGSLVLGTPAYPDGFGSTDIAMYGIHGDLLFQRQSTQRSQASYQPPAWEDDSHVVAPFYQDGRWSLVRIASDGSMEYAVAPVAGGEEDGFVLETR